MPRLKTGENVWDAAIGRMVELYEQGHRIVVSFSGGKDSGVALEICIIAASITNRLPVEVIMRDEEIMFPGTFEYAERIAKRPEVSFHWIYACQPILNVFNREEPFWWVFDPLLDPEQWVRQPPARAYKIPDMSISRMTIPERFPPAPGKKLYAVIGLRVAESRARMYGLFSSGGHITKENEYGVANVRPIYDWSDGDIWKALSDNKWDYNSAYDVMYRLGVPRKNLRIAPPTMNASGVEHLAMAERAFPKWFEKVCKRLPGTRTAAHYGKRVVQPYRQVGETWEQCFKRTCIDTAPQWIKDRAIYASTRIVSTHSVHSTYPLPEVTPCYMCQGNAGSWKKLAEGCYNGDPFHQKVWLLPEVEPEFFRPGTGKWGGKPTW
ncbi:MAG: phosphoadenosine phosphosulfate reductase family protein [Chloroflexi bacterium]|uniref:Phosphoadenosine phosphosulfate reductase family protein n=1 Tax=Candidatus Chlorohelix allophototropha TaxID=3003348 RepID=A0A8T7M2F7_9CHLR|nr:phosphoadenosine phosphosulfate reductase family protein [Chloroflexota bacterium]WJW65808.1 phosphoadenosine phosphosulfate reductase family protein [Chloroflexota bacterium L227-S17]